MPLSAEEIEDLKKMIKVARKRTLNFGLALNSKPTDCVLLLHRKKNPEILMRRAKAAADSPKVTSGKVSVSGKVMTLNCEVDAPPNCARQMRLYLQELGTPLKVLISDATGTKDSTLKAIGAKEEKKTAATKKKDAAPDAKASAPFVKSRTLWAGTKSKMNSEMQKLQKSIVSTCGKDPDLAPIAKEAANLMKYLDVFDGELDDRLGDLIGTSEGSTMNALKAQARATIQEYETALNTRFFAELDTKNGFEKIAVTSTAKQALTAISKVVA